MAIDYRKPGRGPATGGRLVPCLQATSSGAAYGALTFRVGTADETVPTRGTTHLVEHLVMRHAHVVDLRCNASVGLTRTTFWAAGTEAEVEGFLGRVQEALLDLPVRHLDSERALIAVEEEHHPVAVPSPVQHFGAQRYGVVVFEQQLDHLTPEHLRSWVRDRFTAGNAVQVLVGADRGRCAVRLPDGPSHPEPPVPAPGRARVHVDPTERTVCLTALLPTSWAVPVLAAVLDRAVANRLRHREHLAYGAGAGHLRITLDTTMLTVTSDCVPGREADLVAALLDELRRLSTDLDGETVLRAVGRVVEGAEEDAGSTGLTEEAWRLLHGRDVPASVQTLERDLDALTTDDLRELLRTVLDTAVLRTPVPVPTPPGFALEGPSTPEPWPGREFTRADGLCATVSARGLQVGDVQVTWGSLVAAFVDGDDWSLVSRRGVRIDLRPGEFGAPFLAELRDRVPTSVRIDGPPRRT
ncbi:insulinase family protein [Kineococcus sp. NPDC059986]|uniref:M16 family metallopeptidase n=1 Tax=Kineococcus sp. NPDC059986 TaxID=3155538 RepID=UPI00344CEA8A